MKENKHTEILSKFFKGEASLMEQKYLLQQLERKDDWDGIMESAWDEASEEMEPETEERILKYIQKRGKEKMRRRRMGLRTLWNVAAVGLILMLGGWVFYLQSPQSKEQAYVDSEVKVERGQRASITLPDGTKVWVNSDSKITYGKQFDRHVRRIRLEGEAFFDIAKRKDAPFIVSVGEVEVEALGTKFNVKGYSNENTITTFLSQGKVEVRCQDRTETLVPGESLAYNRTTQQIEKTRLSETEHITSWRNDVLQFEGQSLEEIANILSRNFNVSFNFSDESIKRFEFTGTVQNNDLNNILQMISLTAPVKYSINDHCIHLTIDRKRQSLFEN